MKTTKLLFVAVTLLSLKATAQDSYIAPPAYHAQAQNTNTPPPDSLHKAYLGVGTGFNNYVGIIGVGFDLRIHQTVFVRVGVGIGDWGTKLTLGLRYELTYGKGWVLGLSYSYCNGLSNFQYPLQVDTAGTVMTKTVALKLNPAATLNLTASYNWLIHKRSKFYIEFGYALALQSDPYVVMDGSVLTTTSKQTLHIITPGGRVAACGFMFAI